MTDAMSLTILRGGFRILGKASPAIASRFAEALFTTPRRHRPPERERDAMRDATPLHIAFEGMTLRAWRWGAGPAALLVHGWEGRGAQMASFVAPLRERGLSVVAYDGPAHGRSGGKRTTLPQFAGALRAVADRVGDVDALIAHSFGCAAATLAMHDGLHVNRVVFIAPPVDPATYTRRFSEILHLDAAIMDGMKQCIERRFHRKWTDFSVAGMAPTMTAPLLVIHDDGDDEIPLRESEQIVERWPSSRLMVTSGLGHHRILRDASVTGAAAAFAAANS